MQINKITGKTKKTKIKNAKHLSKKNKRHMEGGGGLCKTLVDAQKESKLEYFGEAVRQSGNHRKPDLFYTPHNNQDFIYFCGSNKIGTQTKYVSIKVIIVYNNWWLIYSGDANHNVDSIEKAKKSKYLLVYKSMINSVNLHNYRKFMTNYFYFYDTINRILRVNCLNNFSEYTSDRWIEIIDRGGLAVPNNNYFDLYQTSMVHDYFANELYIKNVTTEDEYIKIVGSFFFTGLELSYLINNTGRDITEIQKIGAFIIKLNNFDGNNITEQIDINSLQTDLESKIIISHNFKIPTQTNNNINYNIALYRFKERQEVDDLSGQSSEVGVVNITQHPSLAARAPSDLPS
jgi:hypothetical protein